jgi:hypothetical protein
MSRKWMLTACAAIVASTFGVAVKAAPINRTSFLTFDSAVAIPGATLTPGTYIIERVDTDASLVRVLSRDRSRVFLTQYTRTIDRPANMPDTPGVTFGEAKTGSPPPVKAWFPQGEKTGQAFVYPRS